MATLIENKDRIVNCFNSIKTAINLKGQSPIYVSEYANAIISIQPGSENLLLLGNTLNTRNVGYGSNQYCNVTPTLIPTEECQKYFETNTTNWKAKKNCCILCIGNGIGRYNTNVISGNLRIRVGQSSTSYTEYTGVNASVVGVRVAQNEFVTFYLHYSNTVRNRTYACHENMYVYAGD